MPRPQAALTIRFALRALCTLAVICVSLCAFAATSYQCGDRGKPNLGTKKCDCPPGAQETTSEQGLSRCVTAGAARSSRSNCEQACGSPSACAFLGNKYAIAARASSATAAPKSTDLAPTKKSLAQSASFYRCACDGGDAAGCFGLAGAYERGEGVSKDDVRMAALYQQACSEGSADGCNALNGAVEGTVVDADSGAPLSSAFLTVRDRLNRELKLGADSRGSFGAGNIKGGWLGITAEMAGYVTTASEVVVHARETTLVRIPMNKATAKASPDGVGSVYGKLVDANNGAAVSGHAKVRDRLNRVLDLDSDTAGQFLFVNVPAGTASLSVDAPGYLPAVAEVSIYAHQDSPVRISLNKRPWPATVTVVGHDIKLKFPLRFRPGSADPLPDASPILQELAELLTRRRDIRNVEVQSHTDDSGNHTFSEQLSRDRARVVVESLVASGVDAGRLTARGYGSSRPLVPNTTEANQAKNWRIQFVITDQGQ